MQRKAPLIPSASLATLLNVTTIHINVRFFFGNAIAIAANARSFLGNASTYRAIANAFLYVHRLFPQFQGTFKAIAR